MLLLAVAYPILLPLLIWIAAGTEPRLGDIRLVGSEAGARERLILALALTALVLNAISSRWLARPLWSVTIRPLLWLWNSAQTRWTAPRELGLDFVRGALIGAGAGAVAFAVAGAVAGAFVGAVAVAVALGVEWAIVGRRQPALVYAALTGFLAAVLVSAVRYVDLAGSESSSLLVFLVALPLVNAVFDFASLGLTRWTLRQSLLLRPGDRLWWLRPALWWAADAFGAVALLAGLCAALLGAVAGLNAIATAPLLDLTQLFADLHDPGVDMTWLYLMIFSTLLPTLAHLAFFFGGLVLRYPGQPVREWLAREAERTNPDKPDNLRLHVQIAGALWFALAAALAALPLVYLPDLLTAHGRLLDAAICLAERPAAAFGWLTPSGACAAP